MFFPLSLFPNSEPIEGIICKLLIIKDLEIMKKRDVLNGGKERIATTDNGATLR
jgi:hypothetical protein